jgi:large conductance mechanosensitive channel
LKNTRTKNRWGILYGNFSSAVLSFLIIFCDIFYLVKGINSLKKERRTCSCCTSCSTQEELLAEIRDLLKNK